MTLKLDEILFSKGTAFRKMMSLCGDYANSKECPFYLQVGNLPTFSFLTSKN